MKHLNFLNSNYFEKEKKVKFWSKLIYAIFFIVILIISIITIKQLWIMYNLKQEYDTLNNFISSQKDSVKIKNELEKKYKNLKTKADYLNSAENKPFNIIKTISNLIPTDCSLYEFNCLNQKNIILKGFSKTPNDLSQFLTKLGQDKSLPKFNLKSAKKDLKNNFFHFEIASNLDSLN